MELEQWKVSFDLRMLYNTSQKQKGKKRVFSQYTKKKKKKKGNKSTGLIFISADLGMLSSGMVLNLLQ